MKKVRLITGVLTAALIAASFAGCGEKAETQDVSAMKQEQGQSARQDNKGTMAKVVSLNGDQLTVALADMPRPRRRQHTSGNERTGRRQYTSGRRHSSAG